ncbi:roadblock/LC7 domain-containing protein [Amycolatopsis sp. NPDC051758]|uniref:roadblock/LC7 domain-containing protein n=1 Tax=Amycolatopsis sp. NPDC051758 TaxID=3363935 RepID=UPI003795264E
MTSTTDPWMLAELTEIPGVRFCVVLASDGLVVTHTDGIDKDRADSIAAICSALVGSASAVQEVAGFAGSFQQTFCQWSDGFLFVRRAGDRTCLAVATAADISPGLIAHSMAERVKQVGESTLSTPARG